MDDNIKYPSAEDIIQIHADIIREDEDASSGSLNEGHIEFAVDYIKHGHFGEVPETLDEKALHLLRLLAANHPFADGNKRTALNATWTFYAINQRYFDYGEEIKAILKMFAVMERMVDLEEAKEYFSDIAVPIDHPRAPTELFSINEIGALMQEFSDNIGEIVETVEERYDGGEEVKLKEEEVNDVIENTIRGIRLANGVIEAYEEGKGDYSEETVGYVKELRDSYRESLRIVSKAFDIPEGKPIEDQFNDFGY